MKSFKIRKNIKSIMGKYFIVSRFYLWFAKLPILAVVDKLGKVFIKSLGCMFFSYQIAHLSTLRHWPKRPKNMKIDQF